MQQTASQIHTQQEAILRPTSVQNCAQSELKKLASQDIDWENLPLTITRLNEALGAEATLALLASHGGANLYVPRTIKDGHPLSQVLEPEDAATLCAIYGGERLDIPKIDAILRQMRKKDIKAARKQGESIADLAMRHRLSRRRVLQILAE